MRAASRMRSIGTETPFEAAARARALEATGRSDGHTLADRLLPDAGVCVLSGTSFGSVGRDHVRISYANSRENLAEALRRIDAFVRGR